MKKLSGNHEREIEVRHLPRAIDGQSATLVVAIAREELIGSVEVFCGGHVARVRSLFVRPDQRRNRIATRMLFDCYAIAKRAGCTSVTLTCRRKNKVAGALYTKAGFIIFDENDESFDLVRSLL
jgi:GNAT superfamily N-acetyltransferase